MNFGRIINADCVNVLPPPDGRCDDPAFRLQNPDVCPTAPRLIIKPGVSLLCTLGSVQFSAVLFKDGIETDVTSDSIFQTSDANVAVVGAVSGNATGMEPGTATITVTYQSMTAQADLTVLAGSSNCCDEISSGVMVLVDNSKSMSQSFSAGYVSKLAYAKAAATRIIGEINEQKDLIGLMSFNDSTQTVLSSPISDKDAVGDFVPGIAQTQQSTSFYDALSAAIDELNALTVDRRVLLLISDGEDQTPSYITDDNPIALLDDFKASGGIVICLGVRSHGAGYGLLSAFATGGFFLNAFGTTASSVLDYVSGLKGYVCSGNCAPTGDEYVNAGQLNYSGFANWHVADGHVDLLGNGFFDLLPGNDLYVDLAGSREEYKGKLISKSAYAVESGKVYRMSLEIAGNQRLDDTPNSVEARVFSINDDGLASPLVAPVSSNSPGAGTGTTSEEFYDYAISFLNDEGETPISPVGIGTNDYWTIFTNTVTHVGDSDATLCRLWRRASGTTRWYMIAESSDVASPSFSDSMSNASLLAAIEAGTIDDSIRPTEINTTGTKNVRVSQTITLNTYSQDFQLYSLSFSAPIDEDVYLSVQQISSPSGYDAIGLLLGSVSFYNVTDGESLLADEFEDENETYVPPACGMGGIYYYDSEFGYGYASGYNCYGEGCLDEPPPVQLQDPNPLSDIESGYTPPRTYTASKTVCKSCPNGFINASIEPLVIEPVDYDTGPPHVSVYKISAGAAILSRFWMGGGLLGTTYFNFKVYGSNNNSTWTLMAEFGDVTAYGSVDVPSPYGPVFIGYFSGNVTAYQYYKFQWDSDTSDDSDSSNFNLLYPDSMYGQVNQSVCATESEESEVSQADADQKALDAATKAALKQLHCMAVYPATESFTATCPNNEFGVSVTRSATRTSMNSLDEAQQLALAAAQEAAEAALDCTGSNNDHKIDILDGGSPPTKASPYPSVLFVDSEITSITKVTITLNRFNHGNFADVHMLLRSPSGTAVLLMANTMYAAFNPFDCIFVLDDDAASPLPEFSRPTGPAITVTYKPTQYGLQVEFPVPAPQWPAGPQSYPTTLAEFIGEDPNGAWSLWVIDDTMLDSGYVQYGWTLTIT